MIIGHIHRYGPITEKPPRAVCKTNAELFLDKISREASAIYKKVGLQPLAGLGLNSSNVAVFMHVDADDMIQVVL